MLDWLIEKFYNICDPSRKKKRKFVEFARQHWDQPTGEAQALK